LRYEFSTDAVKRGQFGIARNPYFEVSISAAGGEAATVTIDRFVSATNSMNGLGRGAFDFSGATQCYALYLNIQGKKDEIEFGISVADGGNPSLSTLCADFIFLY
jgi:hypothetical protein